MTHGAPLAPGTRDGQVGLSANVEASSVYDLSVGIAMSSCATSRLQQHTMCGARRARANEDRSCRPPVRLTPVGVRVGK